MPPSDFIREYFGFAAMGALGWILLWVGGSVWYRKFRGKEIFPGKPADAVFYERMASGNSNRSLLTKIGGARNCLMVAVTPTELIARPWFPFNLMFLPEIYDLDHRIPRSRITKVEERVILRFWKTVKIDFQDESGTERSICLYLRRQDEFLAAIRSPLTGG